MVGRIRINNIFVGLLFIGNLGFADDRSSVPLPSFPSTTVPVLASGIGSDEQLFARLVSGPNLCEMTLGSAAGDGRGSLPEFVDEILSLSAPLGEDAQRFFQKYFASPDLALFDETLLRLTGQMEREGQADGFFLATLTTVTERILRETLDPSVVVEKVLFAWVRLLEPGTIAADDPAVEGLLVNLLRVLLEHHSHHWLRRGERVEATRRLRILYPEGRAAALLDALEEKVLRAESDSLVLNFAFRYGLVLAAQVASQDRTRELDELGNDVGHLENFLSETSLPFAVAVRDPRYTFLGIDGHMALAKREGSRNRREINLLLLRAPEDQVERLRGILEIETLLLEAIQAAEGALTRQETIPEDLVARLKATRPQITRMPKNYALMFSALVSRTTQWLECFQVPCAEDELPRGDLMGTLGAPATRILSGTVSPF